MTFGLKGSRALLACFFCAGLALSACAQGAATKEPFQASVNQGTAADGGASGGGAAHDEAVPAASTGGGGSNGATTGGSNGATNAGGSGGTTGATSGTVNDAGTQTDGGTGAADSDAAVDAGSACPSGTSMCGDSCVDLSSSAANCGRCGRICPGGQACSGTGTCLAPAGCSVATFGSHDYFVCMNNKNWNDARTDCKSWGLDLAIIETADENNFLKTFGNAWIGYNDIDKEGTWLWIVPNGSNSGPAAAYTNWHSGEPSNTRSCTLGFCSGPGEDCGEVYADGTWNDAKCDNGMTYLCETY